MTAPTGRAARTARRRAERARVELELRDLRFVEVPETPASAFARTAVGLVNALTIGAGATWLLLLIAATVGEEALWELARWLDLDAFVRATVVPLFVLAAVSALAISLLGGLDAAVALRLLERHETAAPQEVPTASHRARIATPPGRFARRAVLTIAVLAMAVGGFCLFFALVDDEGRTPVVWAVVAGSAGVVVAWLVARPVLLAVEERQHARRAALESGWAREVAAADVAERRRREASIAAEPPAELRASRFERIDRWIVVAACALGATFAIWFVSVWLRQPCRQCDERYFDEPVERFIDGLSLSGGVAIATVLAIMAALVVVRLVMMRRYELAAVRWVADGLPRRVPVEAVEPMLLGPRAGVWWSRLIMSVFVPLPLYLGLAGLADPELRLGSSAIATALAVVVAATVVATVIGMADARRAASERTALRAVLSPGDPDPASIAKRAAADERKRAKRARRAQRRGRGAPAG